MSWAQIINSVVGVIFNILCVISSVVLVILVIFLLIQITSWNLNLGSNKKGLIITIAILVGCLSFIFWIYDVFGIYLFVNISVYENMFFLALQVLVSIFTVLFIVNFMFQLILFATGMSNKKKAKPNLIIGSACLIGIIALVFWLYQLTGLFLFINLNTFIYSIVL